MPDKNTLMVVDYADPNGSKKLQPDPEFHDVYKNWVPDTKNVLDEILLHIGVYPGDLVLLDNPSGPSDGMTVPVTGTSAGVIDITKYLESPDVTQYDFYINRVQSAAVEQVHEFPTDGRSTLGYTYGGLRPADERLFSIDPGDV
jgi:hypothetical protein